MTDPEATYKDLVTGDPATLNSHVDTLSTVGPKLDNALVGIDDASGVPAWTGGPANAYSVRVMSIASGVSRDRERVSRAYGGLATAVSAYERMESSANVLIASWRNRNPDLPDVIEELFARIFNGCLVRLGTNYNTQLTAIKAVLDGDEVDKDDLDDDTREWVERGEDKNDDWRDDTDGELGPLIPNIAANGDDRGLTPQGLGYDPATRSLLQAYYKDGEKSVLAVIDEVTGKEIAEVKLGPHEDENAIPGHVGGVTTNGDSVYVTDNGKVYEYSLKEIRAARPGEEVLQTEEPIDVDASSYMAFHDGKLYVGSHKGNKLYAYEKDSSGTWQEVRDSDGSQLVIETPDLVQGVMVRDGEFIFSTSYGRQNESALVVQDRYTGERSDEYPLPNMSQGVVEVDGELYVTYESGAEQFDDAGSPFGWFWGVPDEDGLWAMQHMTRTPLSELGLDPAFEVEPATLRSASRDLEDPAAVLAAQHKVLKGVNVVFTEFGDFPAASSLAVSVNIVLNTAELSLQTSGKATDQLAEALWNSAGDYDSSDQLIRQAFRRLHA